MIVFVILLLLLSSIDKKIKKILLSLLRDERFKALGDIYFLQLGIFKKVTVYLTFVYTLKMTGQQRKPGC